MLSESFKMPKADRYDEEEVRRKYYEEEKKILLGILTVKELVIEIENRFQGQRSKYT